ncbi:MAG: RecX family transcriptional regulator [Spirochaetales bacterium]|nr:RecX family transcriptional regulator [Spirochaetales bacterium]
MAVGEDQLENLRNEEQRLLALRKAGDLLARAEQSSGGLFLKLRKKGFSASVSRQAVDRVIELGLLDDERFATFWLESRLRQHPEGQTLLYQGLLSRGVTPESAKAALNSVLSEEEIQNAVINAGIKLTRRHGADEKKLKQALLRKGFSNREIRYFFEHN